MLVWFPHDIQLEPRYTLLNQGAIHHIAPTHFATCQVIEGEEIDFFVVPNSNNQPREERKNLDCSMLND